MIATKCCSQCRHTAESPCPNYLPCLTEGPLCHDSDACREKRGTWVKSVTRQTLQKPAIFLGMGTCGLGAGAAKTERKINAYLEANGLDADVIGVGCVGLCAGEPLMDIQVPGWKRLSFQNVTQDVVEDILDSVLDQAVPDKHALGQYRQPDTGRDWPDVPYLDEHPFFAPQTRCVLANCGVINPRSLEEYVARGGYAALASTLREHTPEETCNEIMESGLRGRGGGGFPTGRKWKFALNATADQKYLICNADEGDPGAFMDRAVIEGDPHRLLEGMAIAAYAIGATKAYIYIRAEYPQAIERLREAITQARESGFLGYNMFDSGFNLDIQIKKGAGAFVCGEETALIHSIEGKRGMPRPRPPFPAVKGLFDKPTIINNVETLANVAAIIANGADWFAGMGTETSKGTKVFAISGKVARTGLVEVVMGTKLRDIVMTVAGGVPDGKTFKAVQIGGPSGGCIPEQHLDIEIDYESLKQVGAMMGSGGLVVMDEDTCMIDVAKFFMDFIQRESCGKCIPCREGTRRMLEILQRITQSHRNENGVEALHRFKGIMYLNRLAETIQDTSLCGLGQTAPNPVLSTLRWFRDEYEAHVYERRCPAGACKDLVTYRIDEEACRGCTLCARKCPVDAVKGAPKAPHYIVTEKCINCGNCMQVCRFNAVIKE